MSVRCNIHTDVIYEGASTQEKDRLNPQTGCPHCIADQEVKRSLDPAAVLKSANERRVAAQALASQAARRAADAKAEAEKHLAEAAAAQKEADTLLADAAAGAAPAPAAT